MDDSKRKPYEDVENAEWMPLPDDFTIAVDIPFTLKVEKPLHFMVIEGIVCGKQEDDEPVDKS